MFPIREVEKPIKVFVATLLIIVVIGYFDYITSPEISFSLFYLIPITFLAFYRNTKVGTALISTIFASIVCFLAEYYSRNGTSLFYPLWNSIMRLLVYSTPVVLIWYLKEERRKQMKTEELLRLSEEKYRTIVDNIGEGVAFLDPSEQFIFANHSAEKIFGVDTGTLLGTQLQNFIAQAQYQIIQEETIKRSNGENSVYQLDILTPNGESKTIVITAVPHFDSKNCFLGTYGVFRDITGEKKAEQEIKQKNAILQKTIADKDKFYSIIAHDLRGPISGIAGIMEIMVDPTQFFSDTERNEIKTELRESARNTFNLLEQLLEWSRMENGAIEFTPQRLVLSDIIEACIIINSKQAKEKGIELKVDIPKEFEVNADVNMLKTKIRNLTSNAIKYSNKGGIVTISATVYEGMINLSVNDTGIGMSKEIVENIYNAGFNTRRSGTNGEQSYGLGLLLCKEFIEKHVRACKRIVHQ